MYVKTPEEILVALPHTRLLVGALDEAGVAHLAPDESEQVGLARVKIDGGAAAAADAVAVWLPSAGVSADDQVRGRPEPDPQSVDYHLDRLLRDLRAVFRHRYHNWTPTLGKNRTVGTVAGPRRTNPGVSGAGEVSHGGGGAPQAIRDIPGWVAERADRPGAGVRVGVLDTAMRSHPYLAGAWVARSGDSTEDTTVVPAEAGHGLFVSGLVRRVAKGATLQIHKLLDDKGVADSWTAAQAIVEIGRSGIDILNLSFVCYTEDGDPPLALAAAIDRLDPAVVVVAAAGNHGFLDDGRERMPAWPAALDDVIAVGSAIRTKDGHRRSAFTPQGPWVDALTPGEELQSTFLDGTVSVWDDPDNGERHDETFFGYAAGSGTSFAAAALSGTIASLVKPGRTAREASEDMLRTARNEHESRGGEADEPVFIDRPRD